MRPLLVAGPRAGLRQSVDRGVVRIGGSDVSTAASRSSRCTTSCSGSGEGCVGGHRLEQLRWVPLAAMRPPSRNRAQSAGAIVERRWATTSVVARAVGGGHRGSAARRWGPPPRWRRRAAGPGRRSRARARQSLALATKSVTPRSPSCWSRPSGSRSTKRQAGGLERPEQSSSVASQPSARFSRTVAANRNASWNTRATAERSDAGSAVVEVRREPHPAVGWAGGRGGGTGSTCPTRGADQGDHLGGRQGEVDAGQHGLGVAGRRSSAPARRPPGARPAAGFRLLGRRRASAWRGHW